MTKLCVKYNPYRMETRIEVNGTAISDDSSLYKVVKGKRMQEWIGKFPKMLVDELNTVEFDIDFHGMSLDWDDFEDVFRCAERDRIIKRMSLNFIQGRTDEDITDKVIQIFTDKYLRVQLLGHMETECLI